MTHTAEEHQTQLAMVAAGLGIAVMPRLGRGSTEGVIDHPAQAGVLPPDLCNLADSCIGATGDQGDRFSSSGDVSASQSAIAR